jgi:hypothetical protein
VTSITASGSAGADYPFLCGFPGHTSPARSAATRAVTMTSARSIGRRSACFMHSRSRRERPHCREARASIPRTDRAQLPAAIGKRDHLPLEGPRYA